MIKVRVVEVEGTPDEVLKVRSLFGSASAIEAAVPDAPPSSGEPAQVSPEIVLAVLQRRRLDAPMRKVLGLLAKAGERGISTPELAKQINRTRPQLSGVLGAFGRRVANTPGWPTGVEFISETRDADGLRWKWLPPVVRGVLANGRFKL